VGEHAEAEALAQAREVVGGDAGAERVGQAQRGQRRLAAEAASSERASTTSASARARSSSAGRR
jgi:hypothetical protein